MTIKSLIKFTLGVKNIHIENVEIVTDKYGVSTAKVHLRPYKRHANKCPICGKKCPGYDAPNTKPTVWRGLDLGGIKAEYLYTTHRIECAEHGVLTAAVPWAFAESRFTKRFDMEVAWLSRHLSTTAIVSLMRIDWKTVGRCVSRALNVLEPDRKKRLDGLVNIGVDETSYKKGHKYITVVVNHDTNEVVWVHKGHGKAVLQEFFNELTEKQRSSIKRVSGDGARWITDCVNDFIPEAVRCLDFFHIVGWVNEVLDGMRKELWSSAYKNFIKMKNKVKRKKGRPSKDDIESITLDNLKTKADLIKGARYPLLKGEENLTVKQTAKLNTIKKTGDRIVNFYELKEILRAILQMTDVEEAEIALDSWYYRASHCRTHAIKKLAKKIKRHKKHILNTIDCRLSNARIESMNNKIKLLIRRGYGFRNMDNMFNMVYLNCSNIVIPLANRKGTIEKERELLNA